MSTTKHRNAGGPFVIFEPGLGISGSLEIDGTIGGRTGLNAGVQIATDTFVTGTLKVGANRRMSLTDNELDISSGDLTLDVAGNIEINADGGTITFKDGSSTLGTITSAGFSGTATTVTLTDNEAANENNLITFVANGATSTGAQSLEMDGDLHYNPSTGTVTANQFSGTFVGAASSAARVNVTANADNTAYPILFSGDTSPDGDAENILADSSVTLNPSTNTITATTFAGALSGNATSATALASGRTLKVNLGSTDPSTAFDGSANITDIGVDGTLPVANGGTGLTSITTLLNSNVTPASLSLEVGTDVQAQSDILDDLAGLTQATNKIPYFDTNNTADTLSFSTSTSFSSANDTTIPSQLAVKTYVQNNAGGGGVSMSGGSSNSVTTKNGSNLTAESNLTFNGNTLSIPTIASSGTKQAINIGGYDRTFPGSTSYNDDGDAPSDAALCIRQRSASASRTEGAIAISTQNGNHTFFIFVNNAGNLAIGSDKAGTNSNPNGIIILDQFNINTDDHTDVVSFTGVHRNIPNDFSLDEYKKLHIGKIVVATGDYQNLEYDSEITKPLIGQALPKIKLASKRNEKACFGVVNRIEEGEVRNYGYGGMVTSTMDVSDADRRVVVNSIGEGGIWVCNINGNLENGDYITTCEVPGLGMRQDSEMLCNYTVAKITQDCNFRINASNYDVEEFEFEGKTYRKAFVGCTYHCG